MTETIDRNSLKIYFGGTIKAAADGLIEGMGVPYTSPEIRDLHSEYFDTETDHVENDFRFTDARIHYNHGLDEKMSIRNIGRTVKAERSEAGVWLQAQLNMADEYEQMIYEMAQNGKLHWSSGALPQSVIVDGDGHIKRWAIIEFSLTPTPAMPHINRITTTKSLLQSSQQTDFPTGYKGGTGHKGNTGASADDETPIDSVQDIPVKDETEMDETMIRQIIRMVLEEAKAGMPDEEIPAEEEAVASVSADVAKEGGDMEEEEMAKAVAEKAWLFINAKLASRQKALDIARQVSKQNINNLRQQPATQSLPAFSGNGNGNPNTRKWGELSVSEMRAYADLSAEEMALVGKLAKTKAPEYDRKALTMGSFVERGILSEEFVKTLAHKAAAQMKGWQPRNETIELNDYAAMKTFHWLKVDDLGATDITGQGAEWVELFYDTQAWRRVRDETPLYDTMVSKGMRVKDIPTGVKGMNVKLVDGNGTAYTLQEGGSVDATGRPEVVANPSFVTTNEIEANLATHIIAEGFTFQLAERSMINVAQELNEDIITTLAESLENTILNGDTRTAASTNINLIDGTPGSGLSAPDYLAWNGIRYDVLITNSSNGIDNAGAALAAVDYERVRAKFPLRFRRRKDNILFIIDEGVETQTRRLAEHFTVGIAGESNATFFTGDLNVLVGYDVYASGFLGLTNGDGKISATAGNNVKGQIYGVFAPYWQYGRQLAINIEEDRFALSQSSVFVATVNHLLKPRSAYAAVGMYDIAVA